MLLGIAERKAQHKASQDWEDDIFIQLPGVRWEFALCYLLLLTAKCSLVYQDSSGGVKNKVMTPAAAPGCWVTLEKEERDSLYAALRLRLQFCLALMPSWQWRRWKACPSCSMHLHLALAILCTTELSARHHRN